MYMLNDIYVLLTMAAFAPWRNKASVIPRQIPDPPPETSTTLPEKILFLKMSVVLTGVLILEKRK